MKEHKKYNNFIFNPFYYWSTHSKSKNFPSMFTLVHPNSDFHGLTYACKKSHNTGINYFYEFDELEIVSLSKNKTTAIIMGGIVLNMVCIDITYKGNFISTCCKDASTKDWKLNDIEIEWE